MMKKAMLLSALCAAMLAQCDTWDKPVVEPLKERVDELTSIKSIVVTKYPSKNTFQMTVDDKDYIPGNIPKNAKEWAEPEDYGLEVSGINGMNEARVLVPGLEYEVGEIQYEPDPESFDDEGWPLERTGTVTLELIDKHRYGNVETEFKISILPPNVVSYTIVAYDENGNRVVAVPSGFTSKDAKTGKDITVYVYPKDGWAIKSSPKYGFDLPPPNNNYSDIAGPPFKLDIYGGLIGSIKTGNKIYLWADFIEPALMLTDSGGTRYYEGADALSTAIGSAAAAGGGTITVMRDIEVGSAAISIEGKNITLQAYNRAAAGSVTVSRAGTDSLFTLGAEGMLTLTGDETRSLVIDGGGTSQAALVTVNGGHLDMRDGVTLQNNHNTAGSGGAVYVAGGDFTMAGGRITGNSSIINGDSVYGGGGVYIAGGVFTMSGGIINENTGEPFGGGVLITGGGFTMSGSAVIDSNNVPNSDGNDSGGGGVAVSGSGYFEMNGGEIKNNSASHRGMAGGGVLLLDGESSFNMRGGTISGNTYSGNDPDVPGAGVFFYDGRFIMSDGALITDDNDLYLRSDDGENNKTINIAGLLTGAPPVARITLKKHGNAWENSYSPGRVVLTGDNVGTASSMFSLTKPGYIIVGGTLTEPAASSGGEVTTVKGDDNIWYQVHTFTDSGTFESAYIGSASILLVGGGGGGGSAGGGGAGGFLEADYLLLGVGSYDVTVGTGGVGSLGAGGDGGDSSFAGYTAHGGGGGGGFGSDINGRPGGGTSSATSKSGSGGGGGFSQGGISGPGTYGVGGTGSTNGGNGTYQSAYGGGGGGGAGGHGGTALVGSNIGGAGGSGAISTITGGSGTYASGGSGSVYSPIFAQANTGNGGNGGFVDVNDADSVNGADGGSGIVIIRFPIQY
jgi:hypothetical protein